MGVHRFLLIVKILSSVVPVVFPLEISFLFELRMQNDPWSGDCFDPVLLWIEICVVGSVRGNLMDLISQGSDF